VNGPALIFGAGQEPLAETAALSGDCLAPGCLYHGNYAQLRRDMGAVATVEESSEMRSKRAPDV